MDADILILGGAGTTGAVLAELLLGHSAATLVLAGRDLGKAERAAAGLGSRYPGRVSARAADAADPGSLRRAFAGVGLVAVAASVIEHAGTVAAAALDSGADYYDLLLGSPAKYAALEALHAHAEDEGRVLITDGGIHPGLSAVMIRALAPAFSRLERAEVAGLLKVDWGAYDFATATIHEFVTELADYSTAALRDGVWAELPWKEAMRRVDFGPPFGVQRCSTMAMEELRRLPDQISSLRDCGFSVSGFNPVADNVLLPLGMGVMKVAPNILGAPYARLFAWGLRTFARPPYGVIWQLEAEGLTAPGGPAGGGSTGRQGATRAVGLRLLHEDGYWLTSAAAAACLLQYLDGSLRAPGLHFQALAVEPARMLRDLQRMGVGSRVAAWTRSASRPVTPGRRRRSRVVYPATQVTTYSVSRSGRGMLGSLTTQLPGSPCSRATSSKWHMAMPRSTRCRSAMRSTLKRGPFLR